MPIREFVVMDEFLEYEGPFELKQFYHLLDAYWMNQHYDKKELKHFEKRTEEGRYIELLLEPFKTISDFMKLQMELEIHIRNLKDVEVMVKGKPQTIQQAKITIRFRAWVNKNYGELWERRPLWFFLRTSVDKFIYRLHIEKFGHELKDDVKNLQHQIKSFLNLYQRK